MPAEGAEAAQSSAPARGRPAMCIARGGAHVLGERRGATTSHTTGPWRLMCWTSQNVARVGRLLHHRHLPPAPLSSPHSRCVERVQNSVIRAWNERGTSAERGRTAATQTVAIECGCSSSNYVFFHVQPTCACIHYHVLCFILHYQFCSISMEQNTLGPLWVTGEHPLHGWARSRPLGPFTPLHQHMLGDLAEWTDPMVADVTDGLLSW